MSAVFAPRLGGITQGGGFDLPGSQSHRAADVLQTEYGRGYRRVIQVVFTHAEWRVDDPRYRRALEDSLAAIMRLPRAESGITYYETGLSSLVSPDRSSTYVLVSFAGREDQIQELVPGTREILAGSELQAHVIGGPAFDYDLEKTSERDLIQAETYSLPAILLILLLVFGSLVAAVIPLVSGLASVSITMAGLWLLGHQVALSVFVRNLVTMVGLGLGVDYSLFIVSRFREEARHGDVLTALKATLSSAGRAVIFSGAAVIVGLAMLTLFSFVFMRSLGIGGMIVASVSVLGAITLLPALLAVLGPRVDAARVIPSRYLATGGGGFWHAWSNMVMRHPVFFIIACMGIMLLLAWPVTGMKSSSPGVEDLSRSSDSRQGLDLFSEKWSLGEASPTYVVLRAQEDFAVWRPEVRDGLRELGDWLQADPRVARVESIAELPLPREIPRDPALLAAFARENPELAASVLSLVNVEGGSKSTMARIITSVEPRSPEARQLVRDLREHLAAAGSPGGMEAMVGGGPAEAVDFTDRLAETFPFLMAAVLVITYFVLLLLFRSVVLPLKAIFMNLLSVSAAFGVLVLVFQDGWGAELLGFSPAGGIIPFVPVILFSILFGLSMDYEVFLLSRIKEEYDRTGDNEHSVSVGLEKTGRIITSAALIMIAVFGSFALTESVVIKEFGIGLAVSIFLDATIVRIILVPATMKLLGRWNWWLPAWLESRLPDFSLRH